MARYGVPYQGSKSAIAKWLVDLLPPSHTFVDLFAGGCAVTHCAMLSGKWERFVANDLTDAPTMFVDAIRGEYDGYCTVPDRDQFNEEKAADYALSVLYSFSNNGRDYLWSKKLEPVKVHASRMLSMPSMHERRMEYKKFIHALSDYIRGGDAVMKLTGSADGKDKSHGLQELQQLQGLERLERLQGLECLQGLKRLERLQMDYREVPIERGATVYADPPYRGTRPGAYAEFDYREFDEWLASVDFPVYVSEYTCPDGCVEIARREKNQTSAATVTKKVQERVFVQERFATVRDGMLAEKEQGNE